MHIDQRYPVPAVGAFIIEDGKILLVKRASEPAIGKWSIPGGSVEVGETLQEATRREVLEETGLEVEVGDLVGASDLIVRRDDRIEWHYVLISFYATVISGEPTAATDVSECEWVPLSEIRDYSVTDTVIERLEKLGLVPVA